MLRPTLSSAVIAAMLSATIAVAAIPNQTPEQLQRHADLIVVGTVQEIHSSRTTDELWDSQTGTVLFIVEKVEKAKAGEKIGAGAQLKLGFWTRRWVGPKGEAPEHGSGHQLPKPDPKAKVRAYLSVKEDGSYEALLPNGLVTLEDARKTSTK